LFHIPGYAPFGHVRSGGMRIVDDAYNVQTRPVTRRILQEGASYMNEHFPKSSQIKRVRIRDDMDVAHSEKSEL